MFMKSIKDSAKRCAKSHALSFKSRRLKLWRGDAQSLRHHPSLSIQAPLQAQVQLKVKTFKLHKDNNLHSSKYSKIISSTSLSSSLLSTSRSRALHKPSKPSRVFHLSLLFKGAIAILQEISGECKDNKTSSLSYPRHYLLCKGQPGLMLSLGSPSLR